MNSTNKPLRVFCVGEAMAELMLGGNEDVAPALGFAGDSMNTAIYLNRLMGGGAEVSYVTVVGHDPLSARLLGMLETEAINTQNIQRSDNLLLGLYAITTDESGERTFSYWRSQSAARTLFQDDDNLNFTVLANANVVYLSAISLAILPPNVRLSLLDELDKLRKSQGLIVVFDSNYRPALWASQEEAQQVVSAAWKITDIALPSIDDEQMLFKDIDEAAVVDRLHGYGVKRGALKRGALGPLSLNTDIAEDVREIVLTDAASIQVVDTTAAGDSFNGGFLSAMLIGSDDQVAMQAGHDCSVRVIGHRGAIVPKNIW